MRALSLSTSVARTARLTGEKAVSAFRGVHVSSRARPTRTVHLAFVSVDSPEYGAAPLVGLAPQGRSTAEAYTYVPAENVH